MGALGPGRLWGTYPAPDPGGIGTHAAGMSDRESLQHAGPFGPTSSPLPHCGTAEGVPTSRAAPGELTRRQARGKTTPAGGVSRLSGQESGPFGPRQALCQGAPGRGGGVHLPACRVGRGRPARMPPGGGPKYVQSPSILQRGRLSRPCRRRSLSAAALRGRHRIRHPSCKPDWVRRARTGRQPAAAPLRAASGAAGIYITPLDVIPVAGSCQILNPRSVLPPQLCVGTSPSGQAANPVFCMPRSAIHQIQGRQAFLFRA